MQPPASHLPAAPCQTHAPSPPSHPPEPTRATPSLSIAKGPDPSTRRPCACAAPRPRLASTRQPLALVHDRDAQALDSTWTSSTFSHLPECIGLSLVSAVDDTHTRVGICLDGANEGKILVMPTEEDFTECASSTCLAATLSVFLPLLYIYSLLSCCRDPLLTNSQGLLSAIASGAPRELETTSVNLRDLAAIAHKVKSKVTHRICIRNSCRKPHRQREASLCLAGCKRFQRKPSKPRRTVVVSMQVNLPGSPLFFLKQARAEYLKTYKGLIRVFLEGLKRGDFQRTVF